MGGNLVDVTKYGAGGGLVSLLEPSIQVLGFELVGIEGPANNDGTVRVYIDSEEGITLKDCEQVSRQVSAVLDAENPLLGSYTLEVSSPGLDRPLFTPEHFRNFCGHEVRLRLHVPIEGRRKLRGTLMEFRGEAIVIADESTDQGEVLVPLGAIAKANLVPEL